MLYGDKAPKTDDDWNKWLSDNKLDKEPCLTTLEQLFVLLKDDLGKLTPAVTTVKELDKWLGADLGKTGMWYFDNMMNNGNPMDFP
jgi:hypothetical protein